MRFNHDFNPLEEYFFLGWEFSMQCHKVKE